MRGVYSGNATSQEMFDACVANKDQREIDEVISELITPQRSDNIAEYKPDWLDEQCNKVFNALGHLPLNERIGVVDQVQDFLRQEKAELKE